MRRWAGSASRSRRRYVFVPTPFYPANFIKLTNYSFFQKAQAEIRCPLRSCSDQENWGASAEETETESRGRPIAPERARNRHGTLRALPLAHPSHFIYIVDAASSTRICTAISSDSSILSIPIWVCASARFFLLLFWRRRHCVALVYAI
jgi:hypothetical protein